MPVKTILYNQAAARKVHRHIEWLVSRKGQHPTLLINEFTYYAALRAKYARDARVLLLEWLGE